MVVIVTLILALVLDPDIDVCMEDRDNCTFTLTGIIPSGLPPFRSPPFSLSANSTSFAEDVEDVPFIMMVSRLGAGVIIVPIIAILDAVAIAKAFAGGKPVDANQEMVAVGMSNILGSFVQAMPTTISLSRAAVNQASGVKTTLGGFYTGSLVIICIAFLMPYCAFIPKATLASVIMTAILFSVEHRLVRPMWKANKIDLVPGLLTFVIGVFYELEMGIFIGMGVHIVIVLYYTARPGVLVEIKQEPYTSQHYLHVTPDQGITFPSVSYIRNLVSKAGLKQGHSEMPLVINCQHISHADFTAASSFKSMLEDFKARSQPVYWLNPGRRLSSTLKSAMGDHFKVLTDIEDLSSILQKDSMNKSDFLNDVKVEEKTESSPE